MSLIKPSKGPHKLYPCGIPFPVGLWVKNENSGSIVNDLSGNGNNGTIVGAVWKPGKFGCAIENDDSTAKYIQIASPFGTTRTSWTVVVWVMMYSLPSVTGDASILGMEESLNGPAIYTNDSTDTFTLYTGSAVHDTGKSVAVYTWYQIAVATDDNQTTVKFYVNGRLEYTNSSFQWDDSADPWYFLNWSGGYKPWNGLIDNAAIFSRTLPARQIAYLSRNPFPWFIEDEVSHLYLPPTGISMPLLMQQMNHFNGGMAA